MAIKAPLYRYWNSDIKDFLFTTNANEVKFPGSHYTFEGIECLLPLRDSMTVSFYRFHSKKKDKHYFDTNQDFHHGDYRFECYAGQVYPNQEPETIPLYHCYNVGTGGHAYLVDTSKNNKAGYKKSDMILGYVFRDDMSFNQTWRITFTGIIRGKNQRIELDYLDFSVASELQIYHGGNGLEIETATRMLEQEYDMVENTAMKLS
jgi:hypothetical protein